MLNCCTFWSDLKVTLCYQKLWPAVFAWLPEPGALVANAFNLFCHILDSSSVVELVRGVSLPDHLAMRASCKDELVAKLFIVTGII